MRACKDHVAWVSCLKSIVQSIYVNMGMQKSRSSCRGCLEIRHGCTTHDEIFAYASSVHQLRSICARRGGGDSVLCTCVWSGQGAFVAL